MDPYPAFGLYIVARGNIRLPSFVSSSWPRGIRPGPGRRARTRRRAVLVGRAHLYGLAAAAGEPGVRHCIDTLAQELRMAMQLCGTKTIADLNPSLIRRRRDDSV